MLSFSLFALTVSAQSKRKIPPPVDDGEILKINTQLVDVPIVVTDKTGKPLLDLGRDNFDIFEDGKKQEIAEFITTNAPFEVALLLDTSGSTRADLRLIKRSAALFINSLRPGDKVSIPDYKPYGWAEIDEV